MSSKQPKLSRDTTHILSRADQTHVTRLDVIKNLQRNIKEVVARYPLQNRSYGLQQLKNDVETWASNNVYVDKLWYEASVDPNNRNRLKVSTSTVGHRPTSNPAAPFISEPMTDGHTRDLNEWFGLKQLQLDRPANHVMILVGCLRYMAMSNPADDGPFGSIHTNHALCAFKHMNTLYCFNAHGEEAYRTRAIKPDEWIWEDLRKKYNCSKKIVFSGHNFQAMNTQGACVGYSLIFGAHMYNEILKWTYMHTTGRQSLLRFSQFPVSVNANGVYSQEFDQFVYYLFSEYLPMVGFGSYCASRSATFSQNVFRNLFAQGILRNNSNNRQASNRRRKTPLRNNSNSASNMNTNNSASNMNTNNSNSASDMNGNYNNFTRNTNNTTASRRRRLVNPRTTRTRNT
jgi:hypothetical protein